MAKVIDIVERIEDRKYEAEYYEENIRKWEWPSGIEKPLPYYYIPHIRINPEIAKWYGPEGSAVLTKLDELINKKYGTFEFAGRTWVELSVSDLCHEIGNLWTIETIRKVITKFKGEGFLLVKRRDKRSFCNSYSILTKKLSHVMADKEVRLEKAVKTRKA